MTETPEETEAHDDNVDDPFTPPRVDATETAEDTDADDDGGRRQRLVGTAVNVGGQVFIQLVRLVSNLVLTRLLFPEAFGVMALVHTIIVGLDLVSDIGVVQSIIQNERDDEAFLDTAWTLGLSRGLILGVFACALAYPMGQFYDEPQLYYLVPLAAINPVLHGSVPTKLHMCLREQRLVPWTLVMVGAKTLAVGGMIVLAYEYRTVWPLVIGSNLDYIFQWVFAAVFIKGRLNRPRWDPAALRGIFHFGKWIFLSTLVTFAGTKFDIFSLPKMGDLQITGIYQIGTMLALLPMTIGAQVINAALLPALSKSNRESREMLQASFHAARAVMLPIHLVVTLGLVLGGPPFFRLYDARYADAGWIVQLFMVSVWFQYLVEAWGRVLIAMGNARPLVAVNVARFIVTAVGCVYGYQFGGLPGFILGNAAGAFGAYVVMQVALRKNGMPALDLDLKYGSLVLALGILGGLGPRLTYEKLGFDDPLVVQIVFAVVMLVPLGLWALRLLIGVMKQKQTA